MKKAILIHVHTNPDQVKRLVSRLRHPDVDIFINVDAKVDIAQFRNTLSSVIYIKNSVSVIWGRFSQVQQILNSLDEIASSTTEYTHVLFISGQDYPVKSIDYIVNELDRNKDKSYLEYFALQNDTWSRLIKKRYEYWHFLPESDIRNNKFVKKILIKLGYKRKYPTKEVFYGACWFCLNKEAVKYLLDFVANNPSFVKFFQQTGCADEFFLQSILLNSNLRSDIINNIYRYIDWSEKDKRPKDLLPEDFEKIKASKAWFARKVNPQIDTQIMDLLDTLNS